MNASGTVISDFIYFFVPIALLPICRNRVTIKTRCCNFRGRMIQAASGGVDASRAAVGGRDAASGNVMPSIYRLRQVGPTKDSQIVFDYGIGNSQEIICRFQTSGKILTCSKVRKALPCLADLLFR